MVLRLLCAAIALCASDLRGEAINGYVLNPFTQARIPGIPVAFYVRQDGQTLEMLRKETDAEGHFSFSGPFLQDGLRFGLAAFYDGIPYFSSTLEAGVRFPAPRASSQRSCLAANLPLTAFLRLRGRFADARRGKALPASSPSRGSRASVGGGAARALLPLSWA